MLKNQHSIKFFSVHTSHVRLFRKVLAASFSAFKIYFVGGINQLLLRDDFNVQLLFTFRHQIRFPKAITSLTALRSLGTLHLYTFFEEYNLKEQNYRDYKCIMLSSNNKETSVKWLY